MFKKLAFVNMMVLALAACAGPERIVTKEAMVPVAVDREVPENLKTPYKPDVLPVWIAPSDPEASSCLAPSGEKALRIILTDLPGRDEQWRAFWR